MTNSPGIFQMQLVTSDDVALVEYELSKKSPALMIDTVKRAVNPFRDRGYYCGQLIMLSAYRVHEGVNGLQMGHICFTLINIVTLTF